MYFVNQVAFKVLHLGIMEEEADYLSNSYKNKVGSEGGANVFCKLGGFLKYYIQR